MLEILRLNKKNLYTYNHHSVTVSTLSSIDDSLGQSGVVLIDGTSAVCFVRKYEQSTEGCSLQSIEVIPRSYCLTSRLSNADHAGVKNITLPDGLILGVEEASIVFLGQKVEPTHCKIAVSPYTNDRVVVVHVDGHDLHIFADGRFFITKGMSFEGWYLSDPGSDFERTNILTAFVRRHLFSRSSRHK